MVITIIKIWEELESRMIETGKGRLYCLSNLMRFNFLSRDE